jgi:hypothetical protein
MFQAREETLAGKDLLTSPAFKPEAPACRRKPQRRILLQNASFHPPRGTEI